MRNVALFLIGCLLLSLPLRAEEGNKAEKEIFNFEIVVVDAETEEPIPAVKIKIGQKEAEAYTDFDGRAKFKNLNQGAYDIEVSFISYEKKLYVAHQVDKTSNKLLIKLHP